MSAYLIVCRHFTFRKYGIKFGENGLRKTNTSHKKYYLTETKRNLQLLVKVEKEIFINKNKEGRSLG